TQWTAAAPERTLTAVPSDTAVPALGCCRRMTASLETSVLTVTVPSLRPTSAKRRWASLTGRPMRRGTLTTCLTLEVITFEGEGPPPPVHDGGPSMTIATTAMRATRGLTPESCLERRRL